VPRGPADAFYREMARRCLDGAEFIKHAILAASVTAENQDLAPRSGDVVTAQAIGDRHQIMHRVPVEDGRQGAWRSGHPRAVLLLSGHPCTDIIARACQRLS
jgi:hypothetical protein